MDSLVPRKDREAVSLVADSTDNRAAILRRYLELAPGARPFVPIERKAPLRDFDRIVGDYPVFRITFRSATSSGETNSVESGAFAGNNPAA